jgi:hypothetical protein
MVARFSRSRLISLGSFNCNLLYGPVPADGWPLVGSNSQVTSMRNLNSVCLLFIFIYGAVAFAVRQPAWEIGFCSFDIKGNRAN